MPTYRSYIIGFFSSLVLTLAAYFSVVNHASNALAVIVVCAVVQFTLQIIYFLHLGKGKDGRLDLVSFALAFGAMFIVIGGSLWIMQNLNYNMTPKMMRDYIIHDEGMGLMPMHSEPAK